MLNSRETRILEQSYDRLKSREITFQRSDRKILLKQEFSDGLQISMNIKDITILDNSLLFTESIQRRTNLSTLNHNVRLLPCQHRGVAANALRMQPRVHRFNYSRTLPQRSSPSGLWTVNPGISNDDSSHPTYIK